MKKCVTALVITMVILAGCTSLGYREVTVPKGLDTYAGLSSALAAGEDILLYDVRTPEEYESGHIPGAVNIPFYDITKTLPSIKKNDIIVLYCVSGVRSHSAYLILSDKGFNHVIDFGALWNWEGELVKSD